MKSAASIFEAFSKLNVLVIGDVMIDRYLTGAVERVSPEAPVPVVHLNHSENRLGGAANVALNTSALGANTILCSVIGKDENGTLFSELLPKYGLTSKGILQSGARSTTVKTRIIAANQHLLRVDQEDTHDLTEEECTAFQKRITELLDSRDIHLIIFQDYNKGVLPRAVIRDTLLEAIKRDIPTAVDPKKKNFWAYRHVTLFKPNLKEVRESLPQEIDPTLPSLQAASHTIRERLGNEITLITLSEKGLYIDRNGASKLMPTLERSIADVSGAGDTVISVAALAMAAGLNLETIATLGNLAGGQVCEKVGVVPVDKEQLEIEYLNLQNTGSHDLSL